MNLSSQFTMLFMFFIYLRYVEELLVPWWIVFAPVYVPALVFLFIAVIARDVAVEKLQKKTKEESESEGFF